MKQILQTDYWNNAEIVKEFSEYVSPQYWQDAMTECYNPGKRLLDIGCGGGRNSLSAYQRGYDVYACDAHEQMVFATRKKLLDAGMDSTLLNTYVAVSKFSELPYESSNFDVVISSGVLHNCDSLQEFESGISEIARVLKKGASLFLNVFIMGGSKNNLVPTEQDCVFLNSYGLPVFLLNQEQLIEMLEKFGLVAIPEQLHIYTSQINEGERTVLRGVFLRS